MGRLWYTPIPYESIPYTAEVLRFMKWEDDGMNIQLEIQPAWLVSSIRWLREHPDDRVMRQEDVDYFFTHHPEEYLVWAKKKRPYRKSRAAR